MLKLLKLSLIPSSVDLGLLVLRVALGAQLFYAHGLGKLMSFGANAANFPDPLGIGSTTSAVLAILGEAVCSVLIVLGLFTRLATIGTMSVMGVAFFVVHHAKLVGENNGELAFVYLIGFLTLFLAGPGKFSLDGATTQQV